MTSSPIYISKLHPKWVFLDLDDTLWDFHANSEVALTVLYNQTEYLSNIYSEYTDFSDAYHAQNDRLWELYHHARISSAELKTERFAALLRRAYSEEDAVRLAAELNGTYLDTLGRQTRVMEGAVELLQWLQPRYLVGILSNGVLNVQYQKLYNSPMWTYVQRMIVSDEIGVNKPDTRIFRYAEAETGATAGECLMVGDNPDADICGALDARWNAVYFNRKGKPLTRAGVPVIDRLTDLRALLEDPLA